MASFNNIQCLLVLVSCVPGLSSQRVVRLPRWYETLRIGTFIEKVKDKTMYGFYTGYPDGLLSLVLEKTEIVWSLPTRNIVAFDIKGNDQNGDCVYEKNADFFVSDSFRLFVRNRMVFGNVAESIYLSLFSSDPDSYVWVIACLDYTAGSRTCPIGATFTFVYTSEIPPNSLDLERVGRELRLRTGLSMDGIPGTYNFEFVQGESECPDDGVLAPGNS